MGAIKICFEKNNELGYQICFLPEILQYISCNVSTYQHNDIYRTTLWNHTTLGFITVVEAVDVSVTSTVDGYTLSRMACKIIIIKENEIT